MLLKPVSKYYIYHKPCLRSAYWLGADDSSALAPIERSRRAGTDLGQGGIWWGAGTQGWGENMKQGVRPRHGASRGGEGRHQGQSSRARKG